MDTVLEPGSSLGDISYARIMKIEPEMLETFKRDIILLLMQGKSAWMKHFTIESIFASARTGMMQVWLCYDEASEFHLVGVTEMIEYPNRKVVRLLILAGSEMHRALPFLDYIELWAKRQGCIISEVLGRPGLMRLLRNHDYEMTAVFLEKDLTHMTEN